MKVIVNSLSLFAGLIISLLGGCDLLLKMLIAYVIADYITGVLKAGITRELSSAIGFKGIVRKVCIFIVIGAAHTMSLFLAESAGFDPNLRGAVIMFYITNEIISIFENLGLIGVPLPKQINKILKTMKGESEDEKN